MLRQNAEREIELAAPREAARPLVQRLLWFVALWLGGVGSIAIVAFGLRLWLSPK
jgi:hypothetical protein